MAAGYVTFLLELLGDGDRIQRGTVAYEPQPAVPANAFVWKIVCDAEGTVVVHDLDGTGLRLIGAARWQDGALTELRQRMVSTPTAPQWGMVEAALRAQVERRPDVPIGPVDRTRLNELTLRGTLEDIAVAQARHPGPTKRRGGAAAGDQPRAARGRGVGRAAVVVGLVVNVVIVAMVVRSCRSEPPPSTAVRGEADAGPRRPPTVRAPASPAARIVQAASFEDAISIARPAMTETLEELGDGAALLARYASVKLRWAEVDVDAETTVGHVLKDPASERGKRMCAEGEITRIERRDLERRKIFVGTMRLDGDDTVTFVAVGSTGELIRRSRGRLCGAVIGRSGQAVSIVGMFDLEENRRPIAEQ